MIAAGERGQGLIEFAVCMLLAAILVLALLALFGPGIARVFSGITNAL
jgi:pilus assembly protein Flp/PilA